MPKKKERLLRQKEKSKSTKHSDESSVVKKPDKKDHKKANEKAKILKTIDKLPVKTRKGMSSFMHYFIIYICFRQVGQSKAYQETSREEAIVKAWRLSEERPKIA